MLRSFLNNAFCKCEQRIFAGLSTSYKQQGNLLIMKIVMSSCLLQKIRFCHLHMFLLTYFGLFDDFALPCWNCKKYIAIQVSVNLCNGGFGCCGSGMHTPGPSGEYLGVDGKLFVIIFGGGWWNICKNIWGWMVKFLGVDGKIFFIIFGGAWKNICHNI